MNILLLAKKNPYPAIDGESIAILQMALGLRENGHKVSILYMNTPKHHISTDQIPEEINSRLSLYSVWVDTRISYLDAGLNLFSKLPYHIRRFYSADFEKLLTSLLQNETFDIVQSEGLFLTAYEPIIRKYSKAKIVYRSHNVEGMIWHRYAGGEKKQLKKNFIALQSKKLLRYEKSVNQLVDAVVPISTADRKFYLDIFPDNKILYIPAGIDLHKYEGMPAQKIQHNRIYFLGGLDWLPNQEGLFWFVEKIWPGIISRNPSVHFSIAGRNAPDGFNKFNEMENIHYEGEVADAMEFARDKFICVVPLLSGSGMKIKIVEAMAQQKLVITTPVGAEGMPEGLSEFICVCKDEVEFASKVLWAIANIAEAEAIAAAGKQYVIDKLDNRHITSKLTEFYQSLCS